MKTPKNTISFIYNRKVHRAIFGAFLIFLSTSVFSEEGRALSDDFPVLNMINELELRGFIPLQQNIYPYRSTEILNVLHERSSDPVCSHWSKEIEKWLSKYELRRDTVLAFFEPGLDGSYGEPRLSSDGAFPAFRIGFGMDRRFLDLFASYKVNLRWARDENYRGRQWEGFAGRPDQVYVRADDEHWGVEIGKNYISWGEGLMLGKAHDPFEKLDIEFKLGKFRINSFAGFLDPYHERIGAGDSAEDRWSNRYLSGHRLEFVSKHFTIALHEAMLYGGQGRAPEVFYMIPFYWYHAEQLNRGLDDNTMVGGDIQILLRPVKFSLELLVDDIQVERKVQSDYEPDEIALASQLDYGTTLFKKWLTLSARYEGATNRTYNQKKPWNRYIYMGAPLGSPYGCDFDRTSFSAKYYVQPEIMVTAEIFYFRNGEGDIGDAWTEPWMDIVGPYREKFPTGVIEKTTGFSLLLDGSFKTYGWWQARVEYGAKRDAGNIVGAKEDYWGIGLRANLSLLRLISF